MSHSLQQGKSSSTGNLLDKDDLALPPPDYGTSSRAFPTQTASTFKQRPYSVAVPAFSQVSQGGAQVPRDCQVLSSTPGYGHLWTTALRTLGLQRGHGGPPAALPSGWGVTGSDPALDTASREEPGHHGGPGTQDSLPESRRALQSGVQVWSWVLPLWAGTFSED